MSTTTADGTKRGPGRALFYGKPTTNRPIYITVDLKERVNREVRYRNLRDDTNEWSFSRVVVDVLLEYFNLPKPGDPA